VDETGTLHALERVGAERVALGLRQVLREARGAVAVEVREACADRRDRDAAGRRRGGDAPPADAGKGRLGSSPAAPVVLFVFAGFIAYLRKP
jgi:hypothetical protein